MSINMFYFTDLFYVLPELFVLVMTCLILLLGVFSRLQQVSRITFYLTQLTLVLSAVISWHGFAILNNQTVTAFHSTFVLDTLAVVLKIFIDILMLFTFWYARLYNDDQRIPANEFYVLGLLATLGMMVLVSAANFITLFLGLEIMSLPIYALVALSRSKLRCIEAAMKYFIIGSVASGMFLYGLSLLFGATKSLYLSQVAQAVAIMPSNEWVVLVFGLVFVMAGIAFKLGAAPFHMWVPDVYDGAPTSVTLLISAAPKLAAFGLAVRFIMHAVPALHIEWQHLLIAIALLSIALGNLAAIIQTNVKRLLAYSSIAHIGYMMLGLACGTARGDAAALFYIITYAMTSLGAFGMIILLSKAGFEANELSDFSGLNHRNPWLAFMMLIMMFSLAGIPPLVGFMAKVGVLEALIRVHSVWLAVVAIVFSIIGAYYYIRVVKVMYFEGVSTTTPVLHAPNLNLVVTINGLVVLLLGIFPSQLFLLCHAAF